MYIPDGKTVREVKVEPEYTAIKPIRPSLFREICLFGPYFEKVLTIMCFHS